MKYVFAVCILLTGWCAHSQRLRVGDTLAFMSLPEVINYSSNEIDLRTFKGKLIILDFWQTSCTQCIKSFKKLDSLQQQFNEFVQIIAVNNESKDSTERFFRKRQTIKLPSIPFITADTTLSRLFPRHFAPWIVWIDRNGVVQYITDGNSVNDKAIQEFLAGRMPEIKQLSYNGIRLLKGE